MVIVNISHGRLRGGKSKTDDGFEYYEFLGIPYAKPPLGNLRFKSPLSPEPWVSERDATTVSVNNIACQVDMLSGQLVGSEDCLYLNVYTPTLTTTNPLPVMVNIHGGGFVIGNGIIKHECGPDFLVEKNVIVVTINYRLNVFGFLPLGIPEAAGNMGLKDQVKALEWVQNNIGEFGGNKNNVTIFGWSAGSASVEYLMLSPLAEGLFHKAILHSGSVLNHWAINFEPKAAVNSLLLQLGYTGSTEDCQAIYEYLSDVPAPRLTAAAAEVANNFTSKRVFFGFVPTLEKVAENGDAFLTRTPYQLLKEGKFKRVPIIRGFCNKEGYMTCILKPKVLNRFMKHKKFIDHWSYSFEENDAETYNKKITSIYLQGIKPDDEDDKVAEDFFGDLDFDAGIWVATKMLVKNGVSAHFYQFSYEGESNFFKKYIGFDRKGASHCDDLSYVFRTCIEGAANVSDTLVRSRITEMWTNFAKTGNPTCSENQSCPVQWPAFGDSLLYLNINNSFTIARDYEPMKMAVFQEIYDKYEK